MRRFCYDQRDKHLHDRLDEVITNVYDWCLCGHNSPRQQWRPVPRMVWELTSKKIILGIMKGCSVHWVDTSQQLLIFSLLHSFCPLAVLLSQLNNIHKTKETQMWWLSLPGDRYLKDCLSLEISIPLLGVSWFAGSRAFCNAYRNPVNSDQIKVQSLSLLPENQENIHISITYIHETSHFYSYLCSEGFYEGICS